jgi:hypothetical protein
MVASVPGWSPRLAHGDEFFGWRVGTRIISFGWVTYTDRFVGPVRMMDGPGRHAIVGR